MRDTRRNSFVIIPDDGISTQLQCLKTNLPLDRSRKLHEERLSGLVGRPWGPDLVDPLVLGVIVDHQLLHEAVDAARVKSVRDARA